MNHETMENRPRLWFVSTSIGHLSEVWLWRQLTSIRKFSVTSIHWNYFNKEIFPICSVKSYQVPTDPSPCDGNLRWWRRFRLLSRRNFYEAIGYEKRLLSRFYHSSRPDIILCSFGSMALRMLGVSRKYNIPIVAHFHGLDLSSQLRNRWYRWSIKKHIHNFDSIVVVGSHQKKLVESWGIPASKVFLIPCGVPTEEFKPLPRDRTLESRVRFIAVGRVHPNKGVNYVVESFASALQQGLDATLAIVGDGPDMKVVQQQISCMKLGDKIHLLGSMSSERVRKQMQESDIFVQHSVEPANGWREGFGVSIAEASAMELPVISTYCGGIPDQIISGHNGILVEQRDVDAMADAMLNLGRDSKLRSQMGTSGRRRVVSEFDTEDQVKKLELVLLEIIDRYSTSCR